MVTPFQICVSYKGRGIAWFEDSLLGCMYVNRLAEVGLSTCPTFHIVDWGDKEHPLSSLQDQENWTLLDLADSEVYVQYHRLVTRSECKVFANVLQLTAKDYEKDNYRTF